MPKKETLKTKNFLRLILLLVGIVIIIAVTVFILVRRSSSESELQPGISYIQSLENTDTHSIENEIKAMNIQKLKEGMESGSINVWQMFNGIVLVGDSRAEEFFSYELLGVQNVMAGIGDTVMDALNYTSQLKSVNPSFIILVYGLNDIENNISVGTYTEQISDVITQLKELLPDTEIYINSIIPATEEAIDKQPLYADIPAWNERVSKYCSENSIPYIDITDTVAKHNDLYDEDGIHMVKEFLQYWALDIITEIEENE